MTVCSWQKGVVEYLNEAAAGLFLIFLLTLRTTISICFQVQICLRAALLAVCKAHGHLKALVHSSRLRPAAAPGQPNVELCPLDELYREECGQLMKLAASYFDLVSAISTDTLLQVGFEDYESIFCRVAMLLSSKAFYLACRALKSSMEMTCQACWRSSKKLCSKIKVAGCGT